MTIKTKFTERELKPLRNYVVWYPQTNRLKVGVTSSFKMRLAYYRQESKRHDLGYVAGEAFVALPAVLARCVEADLCRHLKPSAIDGHREWFYGDAAAFTACLQATKRIRDEVAAILAVGKA